MNCTLMHRKIPVAELELDDTTGFIQKIDTLLSAEHLPVGVPVRHSTTGGRSVPFPPTVPGCVRRWKRYRFRAQKCCLSAATA